MCTGDKKTDDRRFGGAILYHVGEDHNRHPIMECLACDVYVYAMSMSDGEMIPSNDEATACSVTLRFHGVAVATIYGSSVDQAKMRAASMVTSVHNHILFRELG